MAVGVQLTLSQKDGHHEVPTLIRKFQLRHEIKCLVATISKWYMYIPIVLEMYAKQEVRIERRALPLHRLMSVNQSNQDYSKMNMITCSLYQYKPTMKILSESIMLLTDTHHPPICFEFQDCVTDLKHLQNLIISPVYDSTVVIKFCWYISYYVADRCTNKHITQTPIKLLYSAEVNIYIPR